MISVYVIQVILILFFGFLFRGDKKKFLTAAFIILFIVMAFRHARMVGVDASSSYFDIFHEVKDLELKWPNPGLTLVMKVIHLFNGDYQWVIVISSTMVCFSFYRLLVKYSVNGFISVMWFMGMLFYTNLFTILKQAWAMAFLCFAFEAIIEKKPFRFLFFVGLAVVFHFPALVFLPAFWIAKLRINRTFPILMFSLFVIVFIFRDHLLMLMDSAYTKGESVYSSGARFIGTKVIFMIIMLAYGFYQYFNNKDIVGLEANAFSALLYFMGFATIIQTFCYYSNNFERLADYYFQFSILYVPLILSRNYSETSLINKTDSSHQKGIMSSGDTLSKKRISNYSIEDIDINTVLVVAITVFCVWRYISNMVNDIYFSPYYFFWQNVNISMRFR